MFLLISYIIIPNSKSIGDVLYIYYNSFKKSHGVVIYNSSKYCCTYNYPNIPRFQRIVGKSKHAGYHGANIYYLIYQNKNGMLDHYCSVHIHSWSPWYIQNIYPHSLYQVYLDFVLIFSFIRSIELTGDHTIYKYTMH